MMFNKKAYHREYSKQWAKDNPDKRKKTKKKYRETEKGKATYQRINKKFKEENPEYQREYQRKYRKKKRKFISDYKLSKGCAICGYKKCASALDFHHNNGNKEFNIGGIARRISDTKKIKKEMDKCIILCRNCHAELHEKERRVI